MGFGMGDFVQKSQKSGGVESAGLVEAISKHLDNVKDAPRLGFHVSQLYRFCPVKWLLEHILEKHKTISYRLRYRFDVGHAMHRMVQGYLADMGILKGYWRCGNGHLTTEITVKPKECVTCKDTYIRYSEITIRQPLKAGREILGHTDGVLFWGGDDVGLEIKSVEGDALANMFKPYEYPVVQLNLYMHMLRQMKFFPNMRRGMIMFAAMSAKESIMLPIKTFFIDYSESYWNDVVEKINTAIDLHEQYKAGKLTAGDLIEHRICENKSRGSQLECHSVAECFSTAQLTKVLKGDGLQ